jgi:hypothetical protein
VLASVEGLRWPLRPEEYYLEDAPEFAQLIWPHFGG